MYLVRKCWLWLSVQTERHMKQQKLVFYYVTNIRSALRWQLFISARSKALRKITLWTSFVSAHLGIAGLFGLIVIGKGGMALG